MWTKLNPHDSSTYPQPNKTIRWIAPDGNEEIGRYAGGAIWFPAGSTMYIYYTPVMWKYA